MGTKNPQDDRAITQVGTEEPVVIKGENLKAALWAGVKFVYSGAQTSGASGWNFYSGEVDIEPPNASGWGLIRVPQLNTVHAAIVNPRMPLKATIDYPASGVGGCSNNLMLVHWYDLTRQDSSSGISGFGTSLSGFINWNSGLVVSGMVEIFAIGTR